MSIFHGAMKYKTFKVTPKKQRTSSLTTGKNSKLKPYT